MVAESSSRTVVSTASGRDRIVLAALDVIRRRGVDGLTHRIVADEAGVSLGLTTYHFSSLEEILEAAFDLAMRRDTKTLTAWAQGLRPGTDLPAELTDLVLKLVVHESESVYVNFVLVLAAVHRPHLQRKAHAWATLLSDLLAPNLSHEAAGAVATVYDGTLLRQAVTGNIGTREAIKSNFRRACGSECRWKGRASGSGSPAQ